MVADTGMGMNGRGRRAERGACGLLLAGQGWRVVGTGMGMGMGKLDDGFESGLSDPHGDFGHGITAFTRIFVARISFSLVSIDQTLRPRLATPSPRKRCHSSAPCAKDFPRSAHPIHPPHPLVNPPSPVPHSFRRV